MWFSSDRPDRPRRRPSHPTVVAYLALAVAVLGIPATAVAADALIHTRNIANGAVTKPKIRDNAVGNIKIRNNAITAPKIRNNAVTRPKIRDRAITGAKVANNTLTGRTINESTLNITRIAHRISGTTTVAAPQARLAPYPLTNNTYTQPARTTEMYFGRMRVRFPAGCTFEQGWHLREVSVYLDVNGGQVGAGRAAEHRAGQRTVEAPIFGEGEIATTAAHQRRVTATVIGSCGQGTTQRPQVLSVHIHVARWL